MLNARILTNYKEDQINVYTIPLYSLEVNKLSVYLEFQKWSILSK